MASRLLVTLSVVSLVTSIASLALIARVDGRLDALEVVAAARPDPDRQISAPAPAPSGSSDATAPTAPDAVTQTGQSIGTPRDGALANASRLPAAGRGYVTRHPARVFGTAGTIRHLLSAIEVSRKAFRGRTHVLAVGDISAEHGGPLPGHRSHQSGRDVDLGFYYRKKPAGYPNEFVKVTRENLNRRSTWALIEALAETADAPEGVAWIILDYKIQKMLYGYARRTGIAGDKLETVLQYPRGPTSEVGLVRHFNGHEDHMHVRFRCSEQDSQCRSGFGPWDSLDVKFPADDSGLAASAMPVVGG